MRTNNEICLVSNKRKINQDLIFIIHLSRENYDWFVHCTIGISSCDWYKDEIEEEKERIEQKRKQLQIQKLLA